MMTTTIMMTIKWWLQQWPGRLQKWWYDGTNNDNDYHRDRDDHHYHDDHDHDDDNNDDNDNKRIIQPTNDGEVRSPHVNL